MIRILAILILLSLPTMAQKRFTPLIGVNYRYAHKQKPFYPQWSRMDIAPTLGIDHKSYSVTYSFTSSNLSHNIQILYKLKINNNGTSNLRSRK